MHLDRDIRTVSGAFRTWHAILRRIQAMLSRREPGMIQVRYAGWISLHAIDAPT